MPKPNAAFPPKSDIAPKPDAFPLASPPERAISDRSSQIVQSIRNAFARKGFEGTSMQDLAKEAGMSVGNFYRYFPSKTAIIEAMIAEDIARFEAEFDQILAAIDVKAALLARIERHLSQPDRLEAQLWAEVTAAAMRQSSTARLCTIMESSIAEKITRIFAHLTGLPAAICAQRFGAHARYIVLMAKASSLSASSEADPAMNRLMMQGVTRILDQIINNATSLPDSAPPCASASSLDIPLQG